MLPPGCANFAAKPLPIGSDTDVNTMGIVRVSRARAPITGVVTPKIASGRRPTGSFAVVLILSASPPLQRTSIRRLLPSVHPSFVSAPRNAASQDCAIRSLSAYPISTPISRIRSGCCARAANGQVMAMPLRIKSRRLIAFPRLRTRHRSGSNLYRGRPGHVRFGSKADMCSAKGHVRFTPKSGHVQCKQVMSALCQ